MSNDKTILVTGATGQQGGAVARELLKNGYRVKAF
ncbi:MAG: NmrA family NAD(P)-binding protein [Bacteroidetes bacterium]|nr:NmrA family NAD(P)-binding protein [Bacteroidota bacterium]